MADRVPVAARAAKGGRLDWIEAGRGIAATAVVCSHMPPVAGVPLPGPLQPGSMGVEFFFLLSGFIIFHVHRREIGHPDAVIRYVWRRAGRIFSTYWLVLALVLGLTLATVRVDYRPTLSAAFLARNLLLLPQGKPFIEPAWTLRHELLFYVVFGLSLVDRRLGFAIFALWMAAVVLALPHIGEGAAMTAGLAPILLHHYNLDFLLGIVAALLADRGRTAELTIGAGTGAVLLGSLWLSRGMPDPSLLGAAASKALFLAVLGGTIWLARSSLAAPRFLLLLGAASYSIYLLNRDIGFFLARIARRVHLEAVLDSWPGFLFAVMVATCAGMLVYGIYERPVLRWLNARPWALRRREGASALPGLVDVPDTEPARIAE